MYFIYIYYVNNEPLYIGKTKNPYTRYKEHLYEQPVFEKVDRIDICSINTQEEASYFEKYYISIINPKINSKGIKTKYQNLGNIHPFTVYDIGRFEKCFSKYQTDIKEKKKELVFAGKRYPSEAQFIRENIKGKNVKHVRHLRNKVMREYNCDIYKAYELILKHGVDYFGKKYEYSKIDDFIINNPNLNIKQIAAELNESFDKIKSRRVDLISKGIISIKNKKHS